MDLAAPRRYRAGVVHASPALRLTCDGDALVANWRWLAAKGGAPAGAAVKADGYGLGARGVVDRLAAAGARDFFVSSWAEAEALGPLPEAAALSVLHGVREADMGIALASPARPVLNSPEQVARWKAAGGGPCDVMVDTGMNRLGIDPADLACLDGLSIETLMGHLACADEPDHPMNARQLAAFREIASAVRAARASLANSGGVCLGADYGFDLTRPGLALYGGVPVPGSAEQAAALRRVAAIAAEVIQVRRVREGQSVGYGATWTAPADTTVAILNIGYADGLFRALHDVVTVGGRSIVGRISMDLIAVATDDAAEGDWLTLDFGLPAAAAASGLSQYELLTSLGRRYQRRWT